MEKRQSNFRECQNIYTYIYTRNKEASNSNQRKQRKQSREKVWNKVSFLKLNRDQAFKLKGLTYNIWIHDRISIFRPITMQFQKTRIKEFQKLPERKKKKKQLPKENN